VQSLPYIIVVWEEQRRRKGLQRASPLLTRGFETVLTCPRWLGVVVVRASDLWSTFKWFNRSRVPNSRLCAVRRWRKIIISLLIIGDRLCAGKG